MSAIGASLRLGDWSGRLADGVRRWPVAVRVAAGVLAVLLACALAADLIAPLDDRTVDLNNVLASPSWSHPLGTDEVGRDPSRASCTASASR
jgi:peptide/nickel transport system permease protein